jgi:hypothetical protein
MDQSGFETCVQHLRVSARELLATTEGCVAEAARLVSGVNSAGLAGGSPNTLGASVALSTVCPRIEDVMAAYDRLQEALGGKPRYSLLLERIQDIPGPAGSSTVPS